MRRKMKRSLINSKIKETIDFCEERGLKLPPFAYWGVEEWESADESYEEIVENMLGWDVSDFSKGDFEKYGLVTFTFRNGNYSNREKYPKTYCEKLLIVEDGQELPYHFHWNKMEDIINRGGGNLLLTIYNSDEDGNFSESDVTFSKDGRKYTIKAGEEVKLLPGESITLEQGQYHKWVGEPGTGKIMLFEVSMTNDDFTDNRFYEELDRIPATEEDEDIKYLTFNDYKNYYLK